MFKQLLSRKKNPILKKWFQSVVDSYPADSRSFIGQDKNQFGNPVGHTISHSLEALFDELLLDMDINRITDILDGVVRIRAVQDFAPSSALAFIYELKSAIRGELEAELKANDFTEEIIAMESRIDKVGLLAFDKYMECREKVYAIKATEFRNRSMVMLERLNKKYGLDVEDKNEEEKDG